MSTPAISTATLVALTLIGNLAVITYGQIMFPQSPKPLKLPAAEECGDGFNYCGGDASKYPLDEIEAILNNTLELKLSSTTMNRFFKPSENHQRQEAAIDDSTLRSVDDGLLGGEIDILKNLACEARKELVPRYSRAKNVDNKWVYLAQIGHREFQEVEVVICRHPEETCVNDLDSPHGEGSTLCRQIFSTQRLLALDSDGNVNIDTFELPSACVCKTKIKSFEDMLSPRMGSPFVSNDDFCGVIEPTQSITHDRFNRGPNTFDAEDDKMKVTSLQMAAKSVIPCSNANDTLCEDTNDDQYPENAIKRLLYRHKLFANKEFFQRLFAKPCIIAGPEHLKTRLGFDQTERALCETVETYIYPKKAKNSQGVWKYIVNTNDYRQGISIYRCLKFVHKGPCLYAGSQGVNPEATECRQMFSKHSLLSISLDGSVDYDTFSVPTACVCHIINKDFFLFFKK